MSDQDDGKKIVSSFEEQFERIKRETLKEWDKSTGLMWKLENFSVENVPKRNIFSQLKYNM